MHLETHTPIKAGQGCGVSTQGAHSILNTLVEECMEAGSHVFYLFHLIILQHTNLLIVLNRGVTDDTVEKK